MAEETMRAIQTDTNFISIGLGIYDQNYDPPKKKRRIADIEIPFNSLGPN